MAQHFRAYADQYGSDWLLAVAQGYQESELDHSRRSEAGAVGVMQIKPSTAADRNVGIDNVEVLENNIHASIKYMNFLRDRYFSDPDIDPLDQGLLDARGLQRRARTSDRRCGRKPPPSASTRTSGSATSRSLRHA